MQYTAVERLFYLHHNTRGSIRESCIILAIDNFFLEKAYRDWNVD